VISDPPRRFVTHPLPVVANILGQSMSTAPRTEITGRAAASMNGRVSLERLRKLQQGARYQNRHRVQVSALGSQPQPLSFQWNRTTSTKWIDDEWEVAIA
jgi:hypothetical protein